MKEYCRYVVVEKATGLSLLMGEKFKDFTGMHWATTFRTGILRRKVYQYEREIMIEGRACVVFYWVTKRFRFKPRSFVTKQGVKILPSFFGDDIAIESTDYNALLRESGYIGNAYAKV